MQDWLNHCNLIGWSDLQSDLIGRYESDHTHILFTQGHSVVITAVVHFKFPAAQLCLIRTANQMAAFISYEGDFGHVGHFASS